MTPAEEARLRQQLEALLAEVKALRQRAAAKRADAEADERLAQEIADKLAVETPGLPSTYPKGTLGTDDMEAKSPSAGANISAAKTKSRLPFTKALHARNLSVPEWARAQKRHPIKVETARAWVKARDAGGRKIPRSWAARIEKEFRDETGKAEVPATDASWPNGIRDDD